MKRSSLFLTLAAILVAAVPAFGGDMAAPLSTPELRQTISAGKKATVVFFLNPYGNPCKAQNEILQKLQKDRKSSFNIAYVSAMKQEDRKAFYDYGIRSLPSMVLVDSKGKVSRVFPPGIQSYEALAAAIDGVR
jgi:thioredoxin-like negative regulator of GroEL